MKDLIKKYKIRIVGIISFFLVLLVVILFFSVNENKKETEEWINISEFSSILEIQKEGKLLSYPEVTVLSDVDGEVMMMNITEGDIVNEWDILMQIGNESNDENIDIIENQIGRKYDEIYKKKDEYDEFEKEFGDEILALEKELFDDNAAIQIAMDINDTETIDFMRKEIQYVNNRLTMLKNQRDLLKLEIIDLEYDITEKNRESIDLYYKSDKQLPRAPLTGIVGKIYVEEGDEIHNGDKLCTIIDNTYTPEISVGVDFNEYLLLRDLTGVIIITENENWGNSYYEGEIYTRSPILNDEGEYTITVRIIEDNVSDLIISDENTKITVVFTKDFSTIWIPENCFTELGNNSGILTLRDGEVITGKEVGIKNKWNNWINVDILVGFGLEKEEEKDGMNLCVNIQDKDFSLISDLGLNDEKIEVLCKLE